ncbi:MAG: bifunctional demethylmenaquinone methyltransferase/2-methoxy-6-polyprenyl-1,4-benzoquinol methylase UbiE [Planctomycetota bacterium]|nr:bifunctional demethylmenaquinone methyltransferase/2-methoxy-6-polyprenyl-1,4-benzoquinol methylase UbiE [Planctomycetota bacterium]
MKIDKSGDRVRRMFGQIAGRYDLMNHLLSLNVDRYWRWRTVGKVPAADGTRVLDICTGTGDLALAYFKKSKGKTQIVAADFCPEMLEIGAQKGHRAGANGHIRWVEADAQHMPFPDNSFEVVTVAFGLRNVTNTDAGLREMVRVCAQGGRVAVLEFSTPQWQPFKAIYAAYFRYVLPRIGQLLARNREDAYNYLPASVSDFPQGGELGRKMLEAGLSDVRWHPLTLGVATLYLGTKCTE